MSDYAVSARKGVGKTLFCVGVARDALVAGKRVASNIDIYPDKLFAPPSKRTYLRIPDKPTIDDFVALGRGQPGKIEDDNGIIILDETSTFFNARSFADKGRQVVLDWLVHSRKLGWDVYYICQGLSQIDKQIRETQIEYAIGIKRTDKWPIPLITPLFRMVGINVRFPKFHIGITKHGIERDAMVVERKWFRSHEFYDAYDTQQLFLDRDHPQAVGLHTKLSAWHVRGRYLGWWEMNKQILWGGAVMGFTVGLVVGAFVVWRYDHRAALPDQPLAFKVDESLKATGILTDGNQVMVTLGDGRMLPATGHRNELNIDYYLVSGKWVRVLP